MPPAAGLICEAREEGSSTFRARIVGLGSPRTILQHQSGASDLLVHLLLRVLLSYDMSFYELTGLCSTLFAPLCSGN